MAIPGGSPGYLDSLPSQERALLSELERWRTVLARNAALRNPVLRSWELNGFVHGIIDRCLYLRICGDRGLIPPGTLRDLASLTGIQERILCLFRDAKGTSPLALFSCTRVGDPTPKNGETVLDDRPLRGFLETLFSPDFPSDFRTFPVLRLAGVYRTFFRKEIRLMGGHRAVLEETAAARGAGGYPPPPEGAREYLVERVLSGERAEAVTPIRVLDPACGPGNLLLLAYRHLVGRHRNLFPGEGVPDPEARFRILGMLHGVDPDPRAVEVTRMLLLLSAMEGTEEPAGVTSGRDLRDLCRVLGEQIRWGNAVMGPEYLEDVFPRPSPRRTRELGISVDWDAVFPAAMGSGGFDVVMVEPPTHHPGSEAGLRRYLQQHYKTYHDDADVAVYLMERGISLVSRNGTFASLTPDRWLRARYAGPLRKFLSSLQVEEIVIVAPAEKKATKGTGHCILHVHPQPARHGTRIIQVDQVTLATLPVSHAAAGRSVEPGTLGKAGWTFAATDSSELRDRVNRISSPLGRYVVGTVARGDPAIRENSALVDRSTRDRLIREEGWNHAEFRPVVVPDQVRRYGPVVPEWYVAGKGLPGTSEGQPSSEKAPGSILCREHGGAPACTLDTSGALSGDGIILIPRQDLYLLGILNSTLSRFLFRKGAGKLTVRWLEQFPVYVPDFSFLEDTTRHDRLDALVSRLLELHARMQITVSNEGKQALERQIRAADQEIDELVYQLYGLTEDERRIVQEEAG